MTPDPSNLSVDFWMPQTWNRYSYVLNNPLSMVDRNGLWPTFWHDEIYQEALPGLSSDAMQLLEDASATVDYRPGSQDPENAFIHGMRNGNNGETVDQAQQDSDDSIAENQHNAQDIEAAWLKSGHSGIAPAALTAFANVAHTVSDRRSPAHRGFQKWHGTKGALNKLRALLHLSNELVPTPSEFQQSVTDVQNAFNQTFGQFGFDSLTYMELIQRQPQFCVSATDSSGNTVSGCD